MFSVWILKIIPLPIVDIRIENPTMIGYAMSHAEEHEWSEGIVTLKMREDINGHLISETE